MDGGSLATVLKKGGKGEVKRPSNDFFFHRYNNGYPHSAIIVGDYKLIKFWKTKKIELYNIVKDIGEINDISKQEMVKVTELEMKLMQYINEVNPSLATQYSK